MNNFNGIFNCNINEIEEYIENLTQKQQFSIIENHFNEIKESKLNNTLYYILEDLFFEVEHVDAGLMYDDYLNYKPISLIPMKKCRIHVLDDADVIKKYYKLKNMRDACE